MRGGPRAGPTVIGRSKRTTPRRARKARHRINPCDPCGETLVAGTTVESCPAFTLRGKTWKPNTQVGICEIIGSTSAGQPRVGSRSSSRDGRASAHALRGPAKAVLPLAARTSDAIVAIHLSHLSNTAAPLRRAAPYAPTGQLEEAPPTTNEPSEEIPSLLVSIHDVKETQCTPLL